jgi:hypothetical protein
MAARGDKRLVAPHNRPATAAQQLKEIWQELIFS